MLQHAKGIGNERLSPGTQLWQIVSRDTAAAKIVSRGIAVAKIVPRDTAVAKIVSRGTAVITYTRNRYCTEEDVVLQAACTRAAPVMG